MLPDNMLKKNYERRREPGEIDPALAITDRYGMTKRSSFTLTQSILAHLVPLEGNSTYGVGGRAIRATHRLVCNLTQKTVVEGDALNFTEAPTDVIIGDMIVDLDNGRFYDVVYVEDAEAEHDHIEALMVTRNPVPTGGSA